MRKVGLLAAAAAVLVTGLVTGCEDIDTSTDTSKASTPAAKGDGADAKGSEENAALKDVKVTSCGKDEFGQFPQADLTVTNHSSKTSNYVIEVEFVDEDGTRRGEGTAVVNNLATDQQAKEKALGLSDVSGTLDCRITKVTRYASS